MAGTLTPAASPADAKGHLLDELLWDVTWQQAPRFQVLESFSSESVFSYCSNVFGHLNITDKDTQAFRLVVLTQPSSWGQAEQFLSIHLQLRRTDSSYTRWTLPDGEMWKHFFFWFIDVVVRWPLNYLSFTVSSLLCPPPYLLSNLIDFRPTAQTVLTAVWDWQSGLWLLISCCFAF